jgi:ADP-ribose pyrophosphatase
LKEKAEITEPVIRKEMVSSLLDTKYIRVYDLEYAPGCHYYDASRRTAEQLAAVQTEAAFHDMLPDGVGCCIILCVKGQEPKLLLTSEYRYPIGRFVLGPVSGIIDEADRQQADPFVCAAIREIGEETGLVPEPGDRVFTVNPCLFVSPGFTDESCAVMCGVLHRETFPELTSKGAEGTELFEGFVLLTEEEVRCLLREGRDKKGRYYSAFAWVIMTYFALGDWKSVI